MSDQAPAIRIDQSTLDPFHQMYTWTGILSCIVILYLISMILFCTPDHMRGYKGLLLNITISDFALAVVLEQLFRLIPLPNCHMFIIDGLFKVFGQSFAKVAFVVTYFVFCYSMYSLIACFLYRYWLIAKMQRSFRFKPIRYVQILVLYAFLQTFAMISTAMMCMEWNPQVIAQLIPEQYALLVNLTGKDNIVIFGFTNTSSLTSFLQLTVYLSVLLINAVGLFAIVIKTVRFLQSQRGSMTPETYRLHKHFLFALFLQAVYPIFLIVIPCAAITLNAVVWRFVGIGMSFTVVTGLGIYEIMNPLTTLLIVKPYRNGAKELVLVAKFVPQFQRILDAKNVITTEAIRSQHGHDEGHFCEALPDVVVVPQDVQQVSAVVRICNENRIPVIPFGTGTGLEGGVNAIKGGVCIDLMQMSAIKDVRIEDLVCTVQPGVTRKAVNAHLRNTGLWFPVDPGADASVCGMAATCASGTNAVRYGTMLSNVLNLEVVLADGSILHTRGKDRWPRKSAAGYNLTHLFIGSEGTLGVITETVLRLFGIPNSISAAVCTFPTVKSAVNAVVATLQCSIPIARIEFLDSAQVAACNRYSKLNLAEQPTLFLEFHGNETDVQAQAEFVGDICRENDGADFVWSHLQEEREKLWTARHNAYYAALAWRPGCKGFTTDVCVPISRLAEVINAVHEDISESKLFGPIVGHVGDGNFHCIFPVNEDDPGEMQKMWTLSDKIVQRALTAGGTCTGEHGVGQGKRKYLEQELGPVGMEVHRAMKRALDPNGIMNPGKVIF